MIKPFYSTNNSSREIASVLQILNDGGVIIFPTDTVYAIGCHALKERAIERVCKLKGINPLKKHLSIICYDLKNISEYAKVDNATFKVMKKNLPGPFTFILPTSNRLPKVFRHRKEVGIRIPDNPVIREICRMLEAPILVTSVPYNGGVDEPEYLTNPELIHEKWGATVDLVIDGGMGDAVYSTVVSCINEIEIIRQGKGELLL